MPLPVSLVEVWPMMMMRESVSSPFDLARTNSSSLDFEQTYDGLGDQLDETDDTFNDDTFGADPATQQSVGKDFDFAGATSRVAETIENEGLLWQAKQPPPRAEPARSAKPAKTGYEPYAQPTYIPDLEANASIWGIAPKKHAQPQQTHQSQSPAPAPARKMMSLEEVEAMMLAQSKKPAPQPALQAQPPAVPPHPQAQYPPQYGHPGQQAGFPGQPQILQRPKQPPTSRAPPQTHAELPGHAVSPLAQQQPTILQRNRQSVPEQPPRHTPVQNTAQHQPPQPPQPRHILQNPNRLSGHGLAITQPAQRQGEYQRGPPMGSAHTRGPSFPGVVTHPEQLLNLTEEERNAYLVEDAKRAKRNYKIHMLSKDNGLMTPQDKNFITRIQLQQLMAATGGLEEHGPEAALTEDFYYQVYCQIRGTPRQNQHQPANQFAQTYLFQTGGRYGMNRRHHRGGDNHMQRMEQQVQRAVEAAKAKPKNKQLVIEGSLGKISFSNSKTPRPLLNIKRPDAEGSHGAGRRPSRGHAHDPPVFDRKTTLRNIENVYDSLMKLEDHERRMPPPLTPESDPVAIQAHMEWQTEIQKLHKTLWEDLKIMEPINSK
jgi:DNA topoisomerase 2-associated protein PAT1